MPYTLEVKEISKGFRLPKFVQLPRMLRREKAGVDGVLLVHFIEQGVWVMNAISSLDPTAASWDLTPTPCHEGYDTALDALRERWGL